MHFNNLSVVEFNNIIKNILDSEEMLFNCAIVGEISSFKITNNIAYFTLKDDFAVLNCVWFNADVDYKIGDKVKVVGRPNYYVKGGKLSFNVSLIVSFGEGEIFRRFTELKEKLKLEGYFLNKKELPESVENIGVITSSTGAVIRDIISVAKRRNPNVNINIFPVKVQGINAENEIVKGLEFFNNYKVDTIIVARGGGSSEDLSAFNTEIVARACYKCEKPIISAVGHETDYTLIDLVADIRASTPSAAAEIAVKESKNKLYELILKAREIKKIMQSKLKNEYETLKNFELQFDKILSEILFKKQIEIGKLKTRLDYNIKQKFLKIENNLDNLKYRLIAVNPKVVFEKGFAKVFKSGQKVTSVKDIKVNDEINLQFVDGKIKAKILKVE